MSAEPTNTHPFDGFIDGLLRAREGVVRVRTGPDTGVCTGWLITDSLVVVPKFALGADDATYTCTGPDVEIDAHVEHRPVGRNNFRPALLRLASGIDGGALRLHLKQGLTDDALVVLHYPGAVADLQLSVGRVVRVDEPTGDDRIIHDTNTAPGSAGAPLLMVDTLRVVGTHMGKERTKKSAIGLMTLLDELRTAKCWPEIAEQHRLARVAPSTPSVADSGADVDTDVDTDADLVPAALRWNLSPDSVDPGVRARLRPLIVDPHDSTWSVTGAERIRLINAAGSLEALQAVHSPVAEPTAGQRAIDHIVGGPPYDLDDVPIDELPYWLQATQWFAGVAPGLPKPADVQRALARRRIREQLKAVAGVQLFGRAAELDALAQWYADPEAGPVMLTGVGGVGKSALLARFALDLKPTPLLLWLDFDRPDLAAEVAESVLRSLAEQAATQLDGFNRPVIDPSAWEGGADALAAELVARVDPTTPAMLVLDGFEIAQAAKRYAVVWDVLERIIAGFTAVRVIVSGRAPVVDLTLGGRRAWQLALRGLSDEAAEQYLARRNIEDPALVTTVLRAANGIPLVLQLAVRLIDEGDDGDDFEASLPHAMVEGYLYDRILDRVVDRRLRPMARDALVLRQLPVDMIGEVLADRIPEGIDATAAFDQLSRELALVDQMEPGVADAHLAPLRMRPEVRVPLLRLLAADDADRVREIDRRAAQWYGRHAGDVEPAIRAEEIYHRLRLGDVAGAEASWVDDCASFLLNAEAEIPEEQAREWLRQRTSGADDSAAEQWFWENAAYERIRALLAKGHPHSIRSVLHEFAERSAGSPLVAYDAWACWALDHDLTEARRVLDTAGPATGDVGVQRTLLRAFLADRAGDRKAADAALADLDRPDLITGPDGPTGQLAVQAARIRSHVDLARELELADELNRGDDELGELVRGFLTAADVVLPSLSRALGEHYALERYMQPLQIPVTMDELARFAAERRRAQSEALRFTGSTATDGSLVELVTSYLANPEQNQRGYEEFLRSVGPRAHGIELAVELLGQARRRWEIAETTLVLAGLAQALTTQPFTYQMQIALASTVVVFRGQRLRTADDQLDALMRQALREVAPGVWLRPVDAEDELTERILTAERLPLSVARELPDDGWFTGANGLYFYLCGPQPLAVLCQRALGFNELGD